MTTSLAKSLRVFVVVVAVAAAAGGLWFGGMWYAHQQMGMEDGGASGDDMSGMDMGPTTRSMSPMPKQDDMASDVPGYAKLKVPPELQQQIGVTTGTVELAPLKMSVKTVGIVRPDETRLSNVYVKTDGWVQEVFVDFVGKTVKEGAPLLSIYSPDFVTAQREYLIARKNRSTELSAGVESSLASSVMQKLKLLDIPEDEIQQLEKTGEPSIYLTLNSPRTGTVVAKNVLPGQRIMPSDKLFEIADLSTVWVQAKVYEFQLPHVELSQPAIVKIDAFPDRIFEGKVVFVQPILDEQARTTDVRIELPNPEGLLKIGMFAGVEIMHTMGDGLLTPLSSVIRTGDRDIVFRVEKDNRFVPVEVTISPIKFGERFQVLEGLTKGDRVVTSANFLIDSESRLRSGGGGAMPGMEGMDMGGMDMGGQGSGTRN